MTGLYKCVNYKNLKEGQPILAFGKHVLAWDVELLGEPAYCFVPADEEEAKMDALAAENARLRSTLTALVEVDTRISKGFLTERDYEDALAKRGIALAAAKEALKQP